MSLHHHISNSNTTSQSQNQSQNLQQLLDLVQLRPATAVPSQSSLTSSSASMGSLLSSLRGNSFHSTTGMGNMCSNTSSGSNSNTQSALELLLLQKAQGNWRAPTLSSNSNPTPGSSTGLALALLQEAQREAAEAAAEQELQAKLELKIRLLQAQAEMQQQQQQQQQHRSLASLATHTASASVAAPASYSGPGLTSTDELALLQQVLRATVKNTHMRSNSNSSSNAEQSMCFNSVATAPPSPRQNFSSSSGPSSGPSPKQDRNVNVTQDLMGGPRRKGRAIKFPQTLHCILTSLEQEGNTHIASFTPDGKGFVVHKPQEFVKGSLSHHFQSSNYASFQRQINLYCFHRTKQGSSNIYSHPSFQRDQPELCLDMVRTKIKKTPFQQKKKQLQKAKSG